jgi:hypothetical protein
MALRHAHGLAGNRIADRAAQAPAGRKRLARHIKSFGVSMTAKAREAAAQGNLSNMHGLSDKAGASRRARSDGCRGAALRHLTFVKAAYFMKTYERMGAYTAARNNPVTFEMCSPRAVSSGGAVPIVFWRGREVGWARKGLKPGFHGL